MRSAFLTSRLGGAPTVKGKPDVRLGRNPDARLGFGSAGHHAKAVSTGSARAVTVSALAFGLLSVPALVSSGQAPAPTPRVTSAPTATIGIASSETVAGRLAALFASSAHAQTLPATDPNAQLLLTADQLVYDNDAEKVTAIGNVRMDYDGYKVVADRVEYNQKTRRVKAYGKVEILEPGGNRIFADEVDLTDDFGEGFVNALRVETPEDTRFAAESAERFAGQKTVFNHGVYTACRACKERPTKPPLWQIKAEKVILDGVAKTVTYRKARFELFGKPIIYVPYFKHADPNEKRQTGFLTPELGYADHLGFWYRQPYFFATGPSHDLTIRPTYFSRQGFMADVEWRQQLENGVYSFRVAGINQQDQSAFQFAPDRSQSVRALAHTKGRFTINPRWTFGWDVLAQSDDNFARTFQLKGLRKGAITNQLFLRGLHDRSFFDLSAYQFLIQNDTDTDPTTTFLQQSNQALIRPVLDYNYVTNGGLTGGQVNFDFNVTSLSRDELSAPGATALAPTADLKTYGFQGDTTRATAELGWKKTFTSSFGFMLTPSATVRADLTSTNGFATSAAQQTGNTLSTGTHTRAMATAGLEARYPWLIRAGSSSHVFEPMANIFLRPDLAFNGTLPNEDAQSLVFDSSTLFLRDKFSGYDRIESGTRANIGLRYSGVFANGLTLNGLIGQSFHLAGQNPYAREDDLANAGEESGLENSRSDIVAGFGVTHSSGLLANTEVRVDDQTAALDRADFLLAYASPSASLSANYTFITAQPDYAFTTDRHQVGGNINFKFAEHWRAFMGAQYDIEDNRLITGTAGLAYHDECFTFSLAFNESRATSGNVDQSLRIKMSFRTLGAADITVTDDDIEDLFDSNNFFSN